MLTSTNYILQSIDGLHVTSWHIGVQEQQDFSPLGVNFHFYANDLTDKVSFGVCTPQHGGNANHLSRSGFSLAEISVRKRSGDIHAH